MGRKDSGVQFRAGCSSPGRRAAVAYGSNGPGTQPVLSGLPPRSAKLAPQDSRSVLSVLQPLSAKALSYGLPSRLKFAMAWAPVGQGGKGVAGVQAAAVGLHEQARRRLAGG